MGLQLSVGEKKPVEVVRPSAPREEQQAGTRLPDDDVVDEEARRLGAALHDAKKLAEEEAAEAKRAFEMKLQQGSVQAVVRGAGGISVSNEQYLQRISELQQQADEWRLKYETER